MGTLHHDTLQNDWSGGGYAHADSYYARITRKSGTKGCRFRDDGRVVVWSRRRGHGLEEWCDLSRKNAIFEVEMPFLRYVFVADNTSKVTPF